MWVFAVLPMKPKLPSAAVAAYRERLAARNLREVATRRPPIVWEGVYDELYERGMAMLDART